MSKLKVNPVGGMLFIPKLTKVLRYRPSIDPLLRMLLRMGFSSDLMERGKLRPQWVLEKWQDSLRHAMGLDPDSVMIVDENLLLNTGITELWEIVTGTGTHTDYDNTNAYMYVGSGTAAAVATQTDLQGASKTEKAMDGSFPSVSAQTASWKSTYGSSDANHDWEEVGVKNGTGAVSSTVLLLNRKVQSFGTKASGSTWAMTLNIALS